MGGRTAPEGRGTGKRWRLRWLGLALSICVHAAVIAAMTAWPDRSAVAPDFPSSTAIMVTLMAKPEKVAEDASRARLERDAREVMRKEPVRLTKTMPPAEIGLPILHPSPAMVADLPSDAMGAAPTDASPGLEITSEAQALARQHYMRNLWTHLARFRPQRIRGVGAATVAFTITAAGDLLDAQLSIASNNLALNRAALATVRKAAPYPPLPRELAPGPYRFEIAFDAQ